LNFAQLVSLQEEIMKQFGFGGFEYFIYIDFLSHIFYLISKLNLAGEAISRQLSVSQFEPRSLSDYETIFRYFFTSHYKNNFFFELFH
jgi:hypothetical protein